MVDPKVVAPRALVLVEWHSSCVRVRVTTGVEDKH